MSQEDKKFAVKHTTFPQEELYDLEHFSEILKWLKIKYGLNSNAENWKVSEEDSLSLCFDSLCTCKDVDSQNVKTKAIYTPIKFSTQRQLDKYLNDTNEELYKVYCTIVVAIQSCVPAKDVLTRL